MASNVSYIIYIVMKCFLVYDLERDMVYVIIFISYFSNYAVRKN